jgi:hypothetical protein
MTAVQMTQNEMLLHWMRLHPESGITSMEAFRLAGITRLGARIWELRAEGHDIETRMERGHARYILHRPEAEWPETDR